MKEISQIQIAPQGGFTGFGPLGQNVGNGIDAFTAVLSSTVGIMTLVAFIWFLFLLITGAIGIMTAGSDKQALEGARKKITNGIIGVVIVILAVSIISLVGFIFKIPFLDLPTLFNQIIGGAATGGGGGGGGGGKLR